MLTKVLFVISLCVLTYLYGAITMHFKLFPYQTLIEARLAFDAWRQVAGEDQMTNLEFVDKDGAPEPQVTWFENSQDDGGSAIPAWA